MAVENPTTPDGQHRRRARRVKPVKRTPADDTREAFYMLILDWIYLHQHLPEPAAIGQQTRRAQREYGHPGEWASDKSAQIADILWSWHDLLSEHSNETRPTPGTADRQHGEHRRLPGTSELIRVTNAWRYLEPRFENLCELVDKEAFREIHDLHHGIRRTLGISTPKLVLPFPCPMSECGLKTLQRDIRIGQSGTITCAACGYATKEENYRFTVRWILDTLIDAA